MIFYDLNIIDLKLRGKYIANDTFIILGGIKLFRFNWEVIVRNKNSFVTILFYLLTLIS